jgi:hypothetical protein
MEMSMGMGVKLEPLSSCVPLGLPSSSKVNGNVHHSGYTNAHLLPTGGTKRLSLPVSLSLDSVSSAHAYPHFAPPYAYSTYHSGTYTDDYPPSLTYTDTDTDTSSRRGSFEPPFALERQQPAKGGYQYDPDSEPAVYGAHLLDHHLDPRDLDPLSMGAGYAPDPHDRRPTAFPAVDTRTP